MSAIGGHHRARGGTDEWLTPPKIFAALGTFDLDPCAPIKRPWPTATKHYTIKDNGLAKPWFDRVWLNSPYGQQTGKSLAKLADHGNGIALIPARTETKMFFKYVWQHASALLFLEGRLHFHRLDGSRAKQNSGAPSVLISYDNTPEKPNASSLEYSGLEGTLVRRWELIPPAIKTPFFD